uniref:8 kDa Amblyomma family member n=1 Tax=Rhipicephalus appendiculatus TaxID=34631 RepID=A0A131Z897_RHIAP
MFSIRMFTLSFLAVAILLTHEFAISSGYPHKWSHPVYCDRNRHCTPATVSEVCGWGCQCTYSRLPGPENRKGPANMTCSGA